MEMFSVPIYVFDGCFETSQTLKKANLNKVNIFSSQLLSSY